MIWFDLKNLENKISNNELTDKDGFSYVLAFFVLSAIGISFITNSSNGWIKLTQCVISVFITVWGLKTVYEVNNEIDGKDFFKRFFAINWVIGMRLLVITLIFAVIVGIVIGVVSSKNGMNLTDPNPIKDIVELIFMAMYGLICYLLIINSFRRLKTIIK
jgi:hypothetical protein